jgi:hypothetical protein
MTPHDGGGADPVLMRRAAAGVAAVRLRRGGGRGDGLGCA